MGRFTDKTLKESLQVLFFLMFCHVCNIVMIKTNENLWALNLLSIEDVEELPRSNNISFILRCVKLLSMKTK